ncbi:MAG TPA: cytochrome C oxidase subunit IV family protein [Bryobacteraceae bacterium]|nr:cytochrome C oxidase subunit IV family protein [Bryobacteraceae bacterium]
MSDHAEHHIVPKRVYFAVFAALIVLTWVTAIVSTIDLGRLNIFVALSIAVFKASLVVLFFMHVKYGTRLTKMIVLCGLYWLLLLLFIAMADLWTRGWMGVPGR